MSLRSTPVHPVSLISARLDREITPGESRFLDAHLRSCPTCRGQEAELSEVCARLDARPVPPPAPDEVERLLRHLRKLGSPSKDEVEPKEPVAAPRGRSAWVPALLALLLLLILAGASIGLTRRTAPTAPAAPRAPQSSSPVSVTESAPATCATDPAPPAVPSTPQAGPSAPPPGPTQAVAPKPAAKARVRSVVDSVPDSRPDSIAPAAEAVAVPEGELEASAASVSSARPRFATSSVYFSGNGKRLNDDARRTLSETAEWMLSRDEIRLTIEARTDRRKSSEKTLELGRKRALAVARYLEKQGVDLSRLNREAHENTEASGDDREANTDRVDLVPLR